MVIRPRMKGSINSLDKLSRRCLLRLISEWCYFSRFETIVFCLFSGFERDVAILFFLTDTEMNNYCIKGVGTKRDPPVRDRLRPQSPPACRVSKWIPRCSQLKRR